MHLLACTVAQRERLKDLVRLHCSAEDVRGIEDGFWAALGTAVAPLLVSARAAEAFRAEVPTALESAYGDHAA